MILLIIIYYIIYYLFKISFCLLNLKNNSTGNIIIKETKYIYIYIKKKSLQLHYYYQLLITLKTFENESNSKLLTYIVKKNILKL